MGKRRKRKKNKTVFYKVLLIYIVILAVASIVVSTLLWKKLDDYQRDIDSQKAQEEYALSLARAPQLFFDNYMSAMTTDDWIKIWYETYPEHFDPENVIREYIEKNFMNGNISYWKSPVYKTEAPVYLMKDEERELAEIYLAGKDLNWNVDHIKLFVAGDNASSITVPSGCNVFCNDIQLDERYVVETIDSVGLEDYKDSLVNPVTYSTYRVDGLIGSQSLMVKPSDESKGLVIDENDEFYLTLNTSDKETYRQKADNFIRALVTYYARGKVDTAENMNMVLAHVVSDSKAGKIIRQSYDGVLWKPSDYSITYNTTVSDVFVLADNCYAVDVSYENTRNAEDASCYRVYILNLGSGFKIYDFGLK